MATTKVLSNDSYIPGPILKRARHAGRIRNDDLAGPDGGGCVFYEVEVEEEVGVTGHVRSVTGAEWEKEFVFWRIGDIWCSTIAALTYTADQMAAVKAKKMRPMIARWLDENEKSDVILIPASAVRAERARLAQEYIDNLPSFSF